VRLLLPAAILALATLGGAHAQPAAERSNIIVILTDDQRHDELGVLNEGLDTPNMDRMVREGLRFSNAFVTTSLCSPSRATLLTGLPMREHGVVDNNTSLPSALDTFPKALQRSGYTTALIGKWHMGGQDASPRPGFDHWVSFPGQGSYGPVDYFGRPSILNVNGETVPQKGYITDELTDYALEWLTSRKEDAPFLLYLGHKAVHAPFTPAERHLDQYTDMEIVDVTPTLEQMEREPMWVQNQRNSWHGADFPYHSSISLPEFRREYRRTLSAVDDSIGQVLDWVENSGEASNTIVLLLSDNGFLFGEHGLIDKRNAFEESMRIPLVIWGPGRVRSGEVEAATVAMSDIAPTLLELTGAVSTSPLPGRSFSRMLTEPSDDEWLGEVIYEYFWEYNYPHTPTMFAIRTDRYKYVRLHGVWDTDALYDLKEDPGETNNLIAEPELAEVRIDLQNRLHDAIAGDDALGNVPFSRKVNQGAVFRRRGGPVAAEFPSRWLRDEGAPDRLEHVVPDGPHKAGILERIEAAIKARDEASRKEE
jgi:arylsulfatase A-like enzyme